MTDPVLCACGCGVALTPRQVLRRNTYSSRPCARRMRMEQLRTPQARERAAASLARRWSDPAYRQRTSEAMRRAKARERLAHWWAEAHLDRLWARIERRVAVADEDKATLRVLLAHAMEKHYWRAYRAGYQAKTRRHKNAEKQRGLSAA